MLFQVRNNFFLLSFPFSVLNLHVPFFSPHFDLFIEAGLFANRARDLSPSFNCVKGKFNLPEKRNFYNSVHDTYRAVR